MSVQVLFLFTVWVFDPVSATISCSNDNSVLCWVKDQQLSPTGTFEIARTSGVPITDLILSNVDIPILPTTIFTSYPNISFLSLSSVGLKQLSVKHFANAVKLKKLFINGAFLTRIVNGTFRSCTSLENLQLNHNKISVIEVNAFLGLSNLNNLYLSNNSIVTLHPLVLATLPNLNIFVVEMNQIKKLSGEMFLQNPTLLYVSFNDNQLEELPANLFQANQFIETISFTNNFLTSARTFGSKIVEFAFNRIKSLRIDSGLEKLLFEGNLLEVIECADANLTTIDRVYLTNNSLTNFNCIRDMTNLTDLEISANKLARPTQATFAKLTQLKYLRMFNQTRFPNIAAKAFSPLKSLKSLAVDRLMAYQNLRQLFPDIYMVSLTTTTWNCSYTKQVVKVLNRQKISINYNNGLDRQICNVQQTL